MNKKQREHHEFGMANGHSPIAHKVVCVDFDGTIFPWGPLMNWDARPNAGAVKAMQRMKKAGFTISIFTSRMSDRWLKASGNTASEQYEYVHTLCTSFKIPFDEIIGEKIPAVAYVDDKAIEYRGDNWEAIADRVVTL